MPEEKVFFFALLVVSIPSVDAKLTDTIMRGVKKILKWTGIVLLFLLVVAGSIYLIYLRPFMQKMKQTTSIQYDDGLLLMLGGGGNTGILTSDSLVVVIDTKMDEAAKMLHEKVVQLAHGKPILVINTHWHTDHSSGNKYYSGQAIMAGGNYQHEQWIGESGEQTMPTQWLRDSLNIKMGDDTVTIINLGKNIHTPSDIMVYLHKRKMLFGGDVILNKQIPAILGSADPDGYMWAFDWVQSHFDIQKVVPGHGPVGGVEIIENFRQYFKDMKLASTDETQKDKLVSKYDDWAQIPFVMSPDATISAFKKK
jgi:glyoxylase-like metal-dependent hydrolase (beta-lactamase superfamily II)